jgi:integrase
MPVESDKTVMISIAETTKRLGLGTTKVKELMASGEIRSKLVGRRRLVFPVSVVQFASTQAGWKLQFACKFVLTSDASPSSPSLNRKNEMAHIVRRRTADGSRYDVRWRMAGGRAAKKSFRRRKDADVYRRQVEAAELLGLVTDHRAGSEMFGVYAAAWLASRLVKGRPLEPTTVQGYRRLLKRNILPEFGTIPLRRITPDMVRSWHIDVTVTSGSDQAAKSYRLIRAILNTAVDDDLIGRSPCRIKGAGSEWPQERPLIGAATVFDLASAIDPRLESLVLLAGFGALRTSEMLGLLRRDVDLFGRSVTVREPAHEVTGIGRVVSDPKSSAGARSVALPRIVVEHLAHHMSTWAQPGPDGVVFTALRGGPLSRATLSEAWAAAVIAVGAPEGLHVHDLRHHAATVVARMPGITTKELMARIGHASPRAALIY